VKYCRITSGSKILFMGNGDSVDVLGMGTYKLDLYGGRVLLIHDVLYISDVRSTKLVISYYFA